MIYTVPNVEEPNYCHWLGRRSPRGNQIIELENSKALVIGPMHLEFKSTTAISDLPCAVMTVSLSHKRIVSIEKPWVLLIAFFSMMRVFPCTPLALS